MTANEAKEMVKKTHTLRKERHWQNILWDISGEACQGFTQITFPREGRYLWEKEATKLEELGYKVEKQRSWLFFSKYVVSWNE